MKRTPLNIPTAASNGGPDTVIRLADLPRYAGLKRSQLDTLIRAGKFPAPIKLGERSKAWLASEIAEWQRRRVAERDRARG